MMVPLERITPSHQTGSGPFRLLFKRYFCDYFKIIIIISMHVKFSCAVPFEEKKNMVLQVWALRTIVWGWRKLHNMATKYLICNDIANSDVIILTLLWAQKNDNTSKVGGLSLCYSCAVCMMLATLDMTARSCFNQWRQPDARHQLKLLHLLLPTNVNIELQSEAMRTYFLWGGRF